MKYPKINKQPRREVNIPELSGGLNLRDGLTNIRDNQLTECTNMWYKNGVLKTRPGFDITENEQDMGFGDSEYEIIKSKVHHEIKYNNASLVSFQIKFYDYVDIFFWWQTKDEYFGFSKIQTELVDGACDYFVVEKDGYLYCYLSDCTIFKWDYKSEDSDWTAVDEDEIYIPTVMIHCQRDNWNYKGTQFEGYNLLLNKYKMIYSAYNENDGDDTHPMRYVLANPLPDNYIGDIIAEITTCIGENEGDIITTTHTVHIDGTSSTYEYYENKGDIRPQDGLQFYVKKNYVGFLNWDITGFQTAICIDTDERKQKYAAIEDNLVLILPCETNQELKKKVFNMTQYAWFGGAANGISDGSRLFLCGNSDEKEQSLVIWSGLNNPLYFNENNYVYVGNKSQPVKAFGKQGENLIIFKPEETYYTYYVSNDEITADDLINQTVVDYEASQVYFPIVSLNSVIGCDCPDTVQLCRNRLVWLNSDGRIYTLVSANQYSEMTIYPVSEMIESKVKQYTAQQLTTAAAYDFDGYYMLIIGNEAYLMDYNSYGYTHIYGYSKTEDANCLIPWYYWTLLPEEEFAEDEKPCYSMVDGTIIALYFFRPRDSSYMLNFSVLESGNAIGQDEIRCYTTWPEKITKTVAVNSSFTTKLFDFSSPHYFKNTDRVSVGFGNNGGVPINVIFITDVGSESDTVSLTGAGTDERAAAFICSKSFYPCIRAARSFGVKIECDGPLVVDGLSLQYRLLGGAK